MALTATHTTEHHALGHILTAPFRAIGNGLIAIMESNSRVQYVDRLNAMTDAQLEAKGIKRDEIVQHVFRDHMHL
ncbi:DUF1127 domain-containing protein [uncultured Shimia sp.]|uniref:DUF1127 domain-containing protein n=1 Tax=uncultured Shimia sp. TaxID=573152 RepID=UPI00261661BE|nr:DUF1127 domain-containing protein [uncultured Shimia sp.]